MAKDVIHNPTVSVVIPVYNAAAFIKDCVASVIHQTYRDFEIIIIDDGSTDESAEMIRSFNDQRIRFIQNENNIGLIATLNKAFALCRGKYIARLDADDMALPERLSIQVQFMDSNPELALLGSSYFPLSNKTTSAVVLASGKGTIQANLLFNSCFAHPSVMIRKSALAERNPVFNPAFPHAEDYELWVWMMQHYTIDNIVEPLIHYRLHEQQISKTKATEQKDTAQKIRINYLQWLDVPFNSNDYAFHRQLAEGTVEWNTQTYERALAHIHTIILAAQQQPAIANKAFNAYLIAFIADKAKFLKLEGYKIIRESPLFKQMSFVVRWETFFKCWLWK